VRLFQADVRLWAVGSAHRCALAKKQRPRTYIKDFGEKRMEKTNLLLITITLLTTTVLLASCGSDTTEAPGKTIASGAAGNNLTATIANADGNLRKGQQEFTLTFSDASGKPVDVGAVAFNNHMAAMGSMAAMNHAATLTTTGTPGVYRGKVEIDMAGDWQAQITYEGPAGKGSFSLPIVAK
jgi:hypothetical protein